MEAFNSFFYNLFGVNPQLVVGILLVIFVASYFSNHAKSGFARIITFLIGLFLTLSTPTSGWNFIGVGMILPHLKFTFNYVQVQLFILKQIGVDGYYLYLSVYYKTINFFKWIIGLFIAVKNFNFQEFKQSFKKEKHEFNYEKYEQKQREYSSFEENKFYDETQQQKRQEQQQKYQKKQEYSQSNKQSHSSQNNSNQQRKSSSSSNSQFDSSDPFSILGVSRDDDLKTIKKAKNKLMKKYHPDVNPDNIEEATVISQKINKAYEEICRIKGK